VRQKRNKRKKITQAKKKQKYASTSHTTDASVPCARKRNDRINSIFHATHASHATQALALRALRAFEWKLGLSHAQADCTKHFVLRLYCTYLLTYLLTLDMKGINFRTLADVQIYPCTGSSVALLLGIYTIINHKNVAVHLLLNDRP